LAYKLVQIKNKYNRQVLINWPGEDGIRIFAQMAVFLFIFAATICCFVNNKGKLNSIKRLKKVLEY